MPARQGKSKEKIKSHINTPEQYKYYISKNVGKNKESSFYITKTKYVKFLKDVFNEIVKEIIYSNYVFKLPYQMGDLYLRKTEQKVKLKSDGSLHNSLPINWNDTLKLWESDPEAKEKKQLVRFINKNGSVYRFAYSKKRIRVKNLFYYKFKTTRTNKLKLKAAIKNNNIDAVTLY